MGVGGLICGLDEPALLFVRLCELDLDTIDAVHAVDEEDEDENKRYLHAIL